MNKILNSEIVAAVADALRGALPRPQRNENTATTDVPSNQAASGRPASGILAFVGNLLSSSVFSGFLGSGRPEAAVLRGSLVGLASGVEAVTDENAREASQAKQHPLAAVLTVCVYIIGGITAALIYRGMRRSAQATPQ